MSKGNGDLPVNDWPKSMRDTAAAAAEPNTFKTNGPVHIDGVGAMAQKLPDENWYELRLRIRKIPGGAEVQVRPTWERIPS